MSHQPDERELFRRLAADADRAHLVAPEDLRRRTDRRTAARATLGTVAVVVAVAGVAFGANGLTINAGPERDPAGTGPASPTVSETIHSTPPPESIPHSAWLDKGELGFALGGVDVVDVLAPCGRPLVPREQIESGVVPSSGSRQGNYHAPATPEVNTPDGTISQTIVLMVDEQAAAALMVDVEAAIAACPDETTEAPGTIGYSLADNALPASSAKPDRHLLIKVSTSFEYVFGAPPDAGPDRITTYVSVLQVGDAVTFLDVRGWEASSTHLEDVHRLARLATAKLLDWRI